MAFFDGGGGFEEMEQIQRNQDMNRAMFKAREGTHSLRRAMDHLPRHHIHDGRHRDIAGNLGEVPLPNLEGQNFGRDLMMDWMGGGIGALMSDFSAGGKIKRNIAVIERCRDICSQQHGLIRVLLQRCKFCLLVCYSRASSFRFFFVFAFCF